MDSKVKTDSDEVQKKKAPIPMRSKRMFWVLAVPAAIFVLVFMISLVGTPEGADHSPLPTTADGLAQREAIREEERLKERSLEALEDRVLEEYRHGSSSTDADIDRLLKESGKTGDEDLISEIIKKDSKTDKTDELLPSGSDLGLIAELNSINDADSNLSPAEKATADLVRNTTSRGPIKRKGPGRGGKPENRSMIAYSSVLKDTDPKEGPGKKKSKASFQKFIYHHRHEPVRVFEGEFLDGVVLNKVIAGSDTSPVTVSVAKDFFDSSGRFVVFPAGTRIIGSTSKVSNRTASRLFIAFHRMILPGGTSVDFPENQKASALDRRGSAGVASRVNRHLFMKYGNSFMVGLLDGIGDVVKSRLSVSPWEMLADEISRNYSSLNKNILNRNQDILPTITIKPGTRLKVYIPQDILVSPYRSIKESDNAR